MTEVYLEESQLNLCVCVNCSCPLDPPHSENIPSCSTTIKVNPEVKIQEIPLIQNLQQQQERVKVEIVLSEIYKFNYLNCDDPLFSDQDISLCQYCANTLISLYDFYTKFNSLRQQNSFLSKTIQKLDEYIQHLQNSSSPEIVQSKLTNVQTGVKIQDAQFVNCEEEDNYFNDVSGLLECDFNDDDSNHFIIQTSNQKKNPVDKTKIDPTVKLEKLSKAEIARATRRTQNTRKRKGTIKFSKESRNSSSDDSDFEIEDSHSSNSVTASTSRPSSSKRSRNPSYHPDSDSDPSSTWKCVLCSEEFKKSVDLSKHLLCHVPVGSVTTCQVCSENFVNRWSLLDHLRGKHCRVGNFPCPVCPVSYNTKRRRNFHLKHHQKTGQFVCRLCLSIFPSNALLHSHESSCVGEQPQQTNHLCPSSSCPNKIFLSEAKLDEHLKVEHAGQKLYTCPMTPCTQSFNRRRHMNRHVKFRHSSSKQSVVCDKGCGKRFEGQKNLERHQQSCEGPTIRSCEICSKQFKSPEGLHWHMKIHSDNRQTFECPVPNCGKFFYRKSNLRQHQVSHSTIRNHVCEVCGKCYQTERVLREHFLVHNNQKNHVCEICGKSFTRPAGLVKHLRTHSDQRDYKCSVCEKTFKYSESLRLHFLLQHKEAQFVCSVCGAGFPYNFSLQKHMATVHGQP